MRFETPLIRATLARRYQRFLADVVLETGETVTVHCPNSGSMLAVAIPGAEVWLSRPAATQRAGPKRKCPLTWELIRIDGELVGINTARPNALVAEAVAAGTIGELAGYDTVRREVRYGRNSRIDLLFEGEGRPKCFVEVKNVTLKRNGEPGTVEFPDAVTARGTKHLGELADAVVGGARAVMLFLAQRGDGNAFAVAADIDPLYARALDRAMAAGVEALCYRCEVGLDAIRVSEPLRFAPAPPLVPA